MSTKIISVKDFRANLAKYSDEVSNNDVRIIVVKRSKPIFEITPYNEWETIVDFTEIDEAGVDTKDVLKALKKLNDK